MQAEELKGPEEDGATIYCKILACSGGKSRWVEEYDSIG